MHTPYYDNLFMSYNPFIHHRQSIRLKGYDYSSAGYYFVTICCFERLTLFGKIQDNQMLLNDYGLIAHNEWLNTVNRRQNIELDEFVIMPNHMHAIVKFKQNLDNNNQPIGVFQSPTNNLGAIIRGYKSAVSSQVKEMLGHTVWQRNYHEHIIRNQESYNLIANYVINNPMTWQQDCFYT